MLYIQYVYTEALQDPQGGYWKWVSDTKNLLSATFQLIKVQSHALKTNIWIFQVTPTVTFNNTQVFL